MAAHQTGALAVLVTALALSTGCIRMRAPFQPPSGALLTSISVPLQTEFGPNGVPNSMYKGSASSMYFHDFLFTGMNFAWDDCSIAKAVMNGRIETVTHADYEFFHVLGIFGRMTVHAYGTPTQDARDRQTIAGNP